jgi:hypothetical protein
MEVKELDLDCLLKGRLPKGCTHCRKGGKLVLFMTGECGFGCFYCPLSELKYGRDVIYANERPVRKVGEVIEEVEAMDASGTGITGGDPIARIDRTCEWIRALRSRFGAKHHIHLYTATPIDLPTAERLASAGLDELRIHVPANLWKRPNRHLRCLREASGLDMDVGVEVPVVPRMRRELKRLLGSLEGTGISFVNLNELEFSDTTIARMDAYASDGDGYAVRGSRSLAEGLLNDLEPPFSLHFCSARYKDSGQLRRRLLRRGRVVKKAYQEITRDGTLLFAVIEGPGRGAMDSLAKLKVPRQIYAWDPRKRRVELSPWVAEMVAAKLKHPFKVFLVEEYPTWDALEVERTPIGKRH